jgi:hypothetical protein
MHWTTSRDDQDDLPQISTSLPPHYCRTIHCFEPITNLADQMATQRRILRLLKKPSSVKISIARPWHGSRMTRLCLKIDNGRS